MKPFFKKYASLLFFFIGLVGLQQVAEAKKNPTAITITAPTLTGLCVGNVAYTPLGDIVIEEGADGDATTGNPLTIILSMPAGFELNPATGSTSASSNDDITVTGTTVLAGTVTITINVTNNNKKTVLTLSGLQVRATAVGTGATITRTGGTAVMAGFVAGAVCATLTSTLPTLNVIPTATTVCAGQTLSFFAFASGGGMQYNFELKKGGVSQNIQAYSATAFYTTSTSLVAGADYTMEVFAKDVSGCTSTLNTTAFTILANPAAPSITGGVAITYCVGDDMSTKNITATGAGGSTFDWFTDAALTLPTLAATATVTASALNISSASVNTYTRYVTQKGVNCRSVATLVTIQIIAEPVVVLSSDLPSGTKICFGQVATFTASGSAGVNYSFERVLLPATVEQTTAFAVTNTYSTLNTLPVGNYTMKVTGRNSNACVTVSSLITFEILANPVVVFPTPAPSSFLDSQSTGVALTATPADGAGGVGVFSGAGVVGNLFYPNLAGVAGSKTITYTFTATNGCVVAQTITLVINQSGFFVAQGYCNDEVASLVVGPPTVGATVCGTVTNVSGNIAGFVTGTAPNFFVNPNAVTIPPGQDFVTWNGVGQTQFCGTGFGGYAISTRIYRTPNPVFTGSNVVCEGDNNVPYSVALVAGNTYVWSIVPASAGTILGGQSTNAITVNWLQAGSHQVRLGQTANYTSPTASCPKTVNYGVTVNPSPTPVVSTTSASACETTTGHVYTIATPVANRTYVWSISANGTITSAVMPTSTSITVTWNSAGAGTVTVVETNTLTNCSKSVIQNVTINPLPAPAFSVVNVCEGTIGLSYTTPFNIGSTYIWTVQAGRFANISGATTNNVTLDWNLGFTSATISVEETNSNGCKKTANQTVIFNTRPTATITNVNGAFGIFACKNSAGNQYTTSSDANTYTWGITNGTITSGGGSNTVTVTWNNAATGTLTLSKTNGSGCTNSTSQIITLNTPPVAGILPALPATACAGSTITYTAANPVSGDSYTWNVIGGTINGASNGSNISVTWTSNTTGTINFTQTSQITPTVCSHSATLLITILALPTPTILGNGATVATHACENTNGQIYQTPSNVGSSYVWTITGGTITSPATAPYNSNQITVNWSVAGARILTVTETNASNCVKMATVNIDVKARPVPNIFGSTEVCASSIDIEYFTPNTGNTYLWTLLSGGAINGANNGDKIKINWGTGTTGQIQLVETVPTTGCNQTTTKSITIRPLPTPTVTGDNDVCAGESAIAYQVTATTGHAYVWTVTGGAITAGQSTNSITVNWGTGSSGTVKVQQIDNNFASACSQSNTLNITINALPVPAISGSFTVCADVTGMVYTIGAVLGHTYLWTVVGGTIVGVNNNSSVTVNWGNSPSGSVSVKQTNPATCNYTDIRSVVILPLPTPSIAGNLEVCANQTAPNNYPYNYSTSFVGGHIYLWAVTNGNITAGQSTNQVTVAWNTGAGTGTIRVTQTSNSTPACTFFNQKTVTVRDLPSPVIVGSAQVCAEDDATPYQVASLPSHTYQWFVSGGIIATGQGTNAITIDWASGAAGNVQVTVTNTTNPTNCSKVVSQAIVINALPTPDVTGAFTVCANSIGVSYLVANVVGHNYLWTVTNGTITSGQGTNQIAVTWSANNTGIVSVLQTNPLTTCFKTSSKTITILPLPTPSVIGNVVVCASNSLLVPADATNFYDYIYTTPSVGGNAYMWTVTNGIIVGGQLSNQIIVRWQPTATSGTIRVTQTSASTPACTFFDEKAITINSVPVTDVTIANFCFNDIMTFTPTNTNPLWIWDWKFSDGTTSNTPTVTKTFAQFGARSVLLTVRNPLGCEYKISKSFVVNPIPTPEFSNVGSCKNTTMLFTDGSSVPSPEVTLPNNITKWSWDFGDGSPLIVGTDPAVHKNPTKVYVATGIYTVTLIVETNNNCSRQISKVISIFPSYSPTTAIPYLEMFQAGAGGWLPAGTNSSWKLGAPLPDRTVKVDAGDMVWSTGLDANYANAQNSQIESPCFDLVNLNRPYIAMKIWNDSDGADGAALLVTHDDGLTWEVVGALNEGADWYNAQNILGVPGGLGSNPGRIGWNGKDTKWKTARFPLDFVKQKSITAGRPVRFRMTFGSNLDNPSGKLDGFAFDSIFIGSRERILLLEHFTSGSTNNDILTANTNIDAFPSTQEEIVKLNYHTNIAGSDQLNKDNTADPSARALYYGNNAISKGTLDGVLLAGKTSTAGWGLPEYNKRVLVPSPFKISATFPTTPADKFNIQVTVQATRAVNRPLIVHMAVVESEINGAAVSIPTVPKFRNVVKKMLPNAGGTLSTGAWAIGDSRTFNEAWSIYNIAQSNPFSTKVYDLSKLEVILFVQDDLSKEVYQAIRVKPVATPPTVLANEPTLKLPNLKVYPNPAEQFVNVDFGELLKTDCDWELINTWGVALANGEAKAGTTQMRLETDKFPRGMYLIRITHRKSKESATYKLVLR